MGPRHIERGIIDDNIRDNLFEAISMSNWKQLLDQYSLNDYLLTATVIPKITPTNILVAPITPCPYISANILSYVQWVVNKVSRHHDALTHEISNFLRSMKESVLPTNHLAFYQLSIKSLVDANTITKLSI